MNYIRRFLWFSAWGVWVWLGFGLHRELPRQLEVICKLPVDPGGSLIGFVKGTDHVAVFRGSDVRKPSIVIFDASTGEIVRNSSTPPYHSFAWFPGIRDDADLLYVNVTMPMASGFDRGLQEFDLTNGRWRKVCDEHYHFLDVDSRRGVALCCEPNVTIKKCVLLDLRTGKPLMVREAPSGWGYIARARIIEEQNVAILPMAIWPKGAPRAEAIKLEVYNLGPPVRLDATIDVIGHYELAASTSGGLLALPCDPYESTVDVYDLNSKCWTYRGQMDAAQRPTPKHSHNGWGISPSGRSVANGWGVWELQTGRRLWSARPYEFGTPFPHGYILVNEHWSEVWKSLAPNRFFETTAWRSMETGVLEYRARVPSPSFPMRTNASRTVAAASDGHVYRFPPRVDWPLLVLSQAILAAPLVLLWSALWWHRRRAARRQPAEVAA